MTGEAEFEAFVRAYQDMVYATAWRLLGNPAEAEDVAQTVFLRAFERFDDIGRSPSAAGWLRTVTRNLCLNHLARYRRRWRLFSEIESPSSGSEGESFDARLPAIDESERQLVIADALRRLPDAQRVPLVLFHFEGMSYQDIADALRISLAKVKTDIHRGREVLRALLTPADEPR